MSSSSYSPDDVRRLAEATLWRIRLKEADVTTSEAFEAWLSASEYNVAEWLRVEAAWDDVEELSTLPEMIDARRTALGHAQSSHWLIARFKRSVRVLAACAAVILTIMGVGLSAWVWAPTTYTTMVGERRTISLDDGSMLSLDSGSRVRVWYTRNARNLTLLQGQALFDVAHDMTRPFAVSVSDKKVVATGTAFNIDVSATQLLVTMIKGRALVLDHGDDPKRHGKEQRAPELQAGQQFVAMAAAMPLIRDVNVNNATAWQSGQLIFDNESLDTIVARVSRYTSVPVAIGDAATAKRRISGVFKIGDLDGFLDAMTHYFAIRAVNSGGGEIQLFEDVSRPAPYISPTPPNTTAPQ